MGFFNFFSKEKKETLDKGLEKTKQGLFDKLKRAVAGRSKIDDDFLDNLEEVFIIPCRNMLDRPLQHLHPLPDVHAGV